MKFKKKTTNKEPYRIKYLVYSVKSEGGGESEDLIVDVYVATSSFSISLSSTYLIASGGGAATLKKYKFPKVTATAGGIANILRIK